MRAVSRMSSANEIERNGPRMKEAEFNPVSISLAVSHIKLNLNAINELAVLLNFFCLFDGTEITDKIFSLMMFRLYVFIATFFFFFQQ